VNYRNEHKIWCEEAAPKWKMWKGFTRLLSYEVINRHKDSISPKRGSATTVYCQDHCTFITRAMIF